MDEFERARRHEGEHRLFLKLMSGGLEDHSIAEFKDEMECLAIHAIHPAIREAARKAMTRYDKEETVTHRPFAGLRAANR